jgi:hypothetical protein
MVPQVLDAAAKLSQALGAATVPKSETVRQSVGAPVTRWTENTGASSGQHSIFR